MVWLETPSNLTKCVNLFLETSIFFPFTCTFYQTIKCFIKLYIYSDITHNFKYLDSTGEKFTLWGWGSKMGDTPSEFTGFPTAELGAGVEKRGPSTWAQWAAQPPRCRQWLALSPGTNGCCSAWSATCLISGLWTCSSGSVLIDIVKICKYVK